MSNVATTTDHLAGGPSASRWTLPAGGGRITVHLRAEGPLGRAFEVVLGAGELTADAWIDRERPERTRAVVEVAIEAFALEGLRARATGLFAFVTRDDERRVRARSHELLREAFGSRIRVDVGEGVRVEDARCAFVARVRARQGRVPISLEARARFDERANVTDLDGRAGASLRALGIPPPRSPFGLFRVADRVELRFRAHLALAEIRSR